MSTALAKRFFCVFASAIFLMHAWSAPLRAAPPVPEAGLVGVSSAIVYDLDNDAIIFEQNADAPIPPASITKILSMFLAFDHIAQGKATLDSPVVISPEAAATGGSRMGLRTGETVSLKKLLMGMAVSSGNDASHAVAEFVGGTAPDFIKMMNEKAKSLGMKNSVFLNPHGLPANGQQTTARDMLALSRAYLRAHPDSLSMHNTRLLEHGGIRTWNKNPLLGQYPGADGLKSGWIRASGYNLIFTATRNGRRLLAVILGAPDMYVRGAEACRLLDASFMVCENNAPSVAAALDLLPVDLDRIDPRKTGRDAGLLKPKPHISTERQKALAEKFRRARYAFNADGNLRLYAATRGKGNVDKGATGSAKKNASDLRKGKAEIRKNLAAKRGGDSRKLQTASKAARKKGNEAVKNARNGKNRQVASSAARKQAKGKGKSETPKNKSHASKRGKGAPRG